ncbi:DUF4325 domain-containing protein, partial [Mesorhizobium sp. B2-6-7]
SAIDQVDVGRDFSKTTGGRYRKLGPFSGEQFRQEWLVPKMKSAIETGERFRVRIDTVSRSYQPSFLDEAFAGLVRDEGFSKPDVQRLLVIVSDEPRFQKYKALAESYINSVN